MLANLDEDFNNSFSSYAVPGGPLGPQAVVPINAKTYDPAQIMAGAGFNQAAWPFQSVSMYAAPAVIPTAAVGVNPWDALYGPVGDSVYVSLAPVAVYNGPPQIGRESNA